MRPQAELRWLPPLILIAAGLAAYHNSFFGPFIFDDHPSIVLNPYIRQLATAWSAPPETPLAGRPLASVTVAVNYALGGLQVWGYHVFNLLVHMLTAVVLYGVIRRTCQTPPLQQRYGDAAGWLGLTVALVWLVHPLMTDSVTYVVQRTELLMGLWFLLTLYTVIRGARAAVPRGWYAAAVVCCAMGMASKQVMVSAPIVVLLYDRIFLSGSWRTAWHRRRGLYLCLASTWVVLAGLVIGFPRPETAGFGFEELTPWHYAMTQLGVIVQYLRLAFWPSALVLDYDGWPIARNLAAVWPAALLIGALGSATLFALRARPTLGFLGAWFFLILAPTSSLLPIVTEIAAERRMYLPLIAVVALGVLGGYRLVGWLMRGPIFARLRQGVLVTVVAALVLILGTATVRRNAEYRSAIAIWRDAVTKRPDNPRAHNNLGKAFVDEGRWEEAMTHFAVALRLTPESAEVHSNVGAALTEQGRLDEAVHHYTEALRVDPDHAISHNNLGRTLAQQGKLEAATTHLARAIQLRPYYAEAHSNLGNVLSLQGEFEEAFVVYTTALRLRVDSADTYNNIGTALSLQGHFEEAAVNFAKALALRPDYVRAQNNLARAQAMQQQGESTGGHQRRGALRP